MDRKELTEIGLGILNENPDPNIQYLIRTKIFNEKPSPSELRESKWYSLLEREQYENGSWGRFHSQDSKNKSIFCTTELAVRRALSIGIEINDPILKRAKSYMEKVLKNELKIIDRPEKNDRWATGKELFVASTLSSIDPDNKILDGIYSKWLEIAKIAFSSGEYRYEADKLAHKKLNGIKSEIKYLQLNNRYALTLLSSRIRHVSKELDYNIVNWVWNVSGIGYMGDMRLSGFVDSDDSQIINIWFPCSFLLSRFMSSREICHDFVKFIIKKRNSDGYWNYGALKKNNDLFPLSENYRNQKNKKIDCTVNTILLLNRLLP